MKKFLFLAAFGVASLVSANSFSNRDFVTQSLIKNTNYILGYCYTTIYRVNADGSQTVVKTDVSLQPDEESCRLHSQIVLMEAMLAAG